MSDGFRAVLVLLLGWLALVPPAGAAAPPVLGPAEWKAATLFKVLPYVRWPDNALGAGTNKFVIGILGPDPFAGVLGQLFDGEKVHGRPVLVRKVAEPVEAAQCHVLFVPADQVEAWRKASPASPRHVFVVGDSKDFARSAGTLNLDFEKKKLEINPQAAARAGLKVDAKILGISIIVKDAEIKQGRARDIEPAGPVATSTPVPPRRSAGLRPGGALRLRSRPRFDRTLAELGSRPSATTG